MSLLRSKTLTIMWAAMIAGKFYEVFAQNDDIEQSFKAACSYIKAEKGSGENTRRLWKEGQESINAFPWKNVFKSGDWRLVNYKPMENPFKIFLAYSREDKEEKVRLAKQLKLLKRRGYIDVFDEAEIQAGRASKEVIQQNLNTAQIILLFVTENLFFDDDSEELIDAAVKRYENEGTILIPVYVQQCDIKGREICTIRTSSQKRIAEWKNG